MLHTYGDGEVTVRFIAAKVKVAPTKATSVPRLELVTAVLVLRLERTELLEIPFENYTLYTFYDVPNKLPPFGLSDHDTVAVQPLARQNLPKNKILLKSRDLRATNRMAMRTYLEEVNLGLLVGLKGSCEEKTRTLETIIKTGMDTLLRPKSKTVIANEPPWINKQLKFPNSRSSNRVCSR